MGSICNIVYFAVSVYFGSFVIYNPETISLLYHQEYEEQPGRTRIKCQKLTCDPSEAYNQTVEYLRDFNHSSGAAITELPQGAWYCSVISSTPVSVGAVSPGCSEKLKKKVTDVITQ